MSSPVIVIAVLLLYTLIREVFFIHSLNKLVNKLMSRTYYDYQISEKVTKEKKQQEVQQQNGLEVLEPDFVESMNNII